MAEFGVGTALATLPLALKGIALYADVATKFRLLINYPSEIQGVSVTLRTNSFLVHDAATALVQSICGGDLSMAEELLAAPEHALLLGLNASSMPMGPLEGMGAEFDLWTDRLDKMYPPTAQQTSRLPGKLPLFRKRVKLSLSRDELDNMIHDLRGAVGEFERLSVRIEQRIKSSAGGKSHQASPAEPPKAQPRSLEIYHRIQATSSTLYRIMAMRCSCARRDQHLLSISLLDRSILGSDSPRTVFSIAVSACHDPSFKQRILLEAELVDFRTEDRRRPFGLIDRLHAPTGRIGGAVMNALYTSHHESSTRYTRPWTAPESPPAAAYFDTSCPQAGQNTDITDDMCRHFQDAMKNPGQTWKRYIRGAEDNARFEMRPHRKGTLGTQRSLADIITSMSQTSDDNRQPGLPRASLARLAGALAHLILQYHSTPWLSGTWKSSDVTFIEYLEKEPNNIEQHGHGSEELLSQPYLMTAGFPGSVPGPGVPASLMRGAMDSSLSSGTARSEILFHFGVILLELGFGQPWSMLRQSVLADSSLGGTDGRNVSNGKVAEKLAQNKRLQDRMGMNYCRIARKCLNCDFGLGEDDFENADLQGAFLVDVVTALERTEGMLKGLDTWHFHHQ
ncbi:hypothetical protein QBC34DRAFT_498348 [Podospora aff. communis PSN243]|uniref:DUF7580 domain-containing protein n=1 Tax=Podospora aff. communis PSN243 TaxID=3040156 RepID=A0AAV9G894_9PEZI|nr:hypothetical protein QBC34DRAFT_498348 [Podospora aff. communis PSN243]